MHQPLVSIITVVYNGEKTIERTIQSVLNQTYKNIEYIIIDGASTDKTVDIIKRYQDKISYWTSEPDDGIYDAWNKGLVLTKGDIIGFCNADDYYENDAIKKAVKAFQNDPLQITYGNTQFLNETQCAGISRGYFDEKKIYRGFGFMHTTIFASKEVYQLIGNFNTSYRIAGDTDWMLRAYKQNIKFTQCDNLTYMGIGGISQIHEKKAFKEFTSSLKEHGFNPKRILLSKIRISFFYFIKNLIGLQRIMALRDQTINIIIYGFNFIYNYLPFFTLKNKFLRFFNILIGDNTYLHTPVKFFTIGKLKIGNNTSISPNCYLDNRGHINIGDNVSISHSTRIYTAGHDIHSPCFSFVAKPVKIGNNVVIFTNVLIMPGIHIGKNAVILAGSVVTKNVPENCVMGGNPASFIKKRDTNIKYTIKHDLWFVS